MKRLRYWLARFVWWLRTPEVPCTLRSCPAPRVGFSAWCRAHTDQILGGTHDALLAQHLTDLRQRAARREA